MNDELCYCPQCVAARKAAQMQKTLKFLYGAAALVLVVIVAWFIVGKVNEGYFDSLIVAGQGVVDFVTGTHSVQADQPVLSQPNGDVPRVEVLPATVPDTSFQVSPATVVVQDVVPVATDVPLPTATLVPVVPTEAPFVVPEIPPTAVPHTVVQEPPAPVATYAPVGELPQVFPSDTTEQAANAYEKWGESFIEACQKAAVEGRRSHPNCKEALNDLGQGR